MKINPTDEMLFGQALSQEAIRRAFADQRQQITHLEEQLDASGEFVAELPRLQYEKEQAQTQNRLLRAAVTRLEEALRREQARVEEARAGHQALVEEIRALTARRQQQSRLVRQLQQQLQTRDQKLTQLNASGADLTVPGLSVDQSDTTRSGQPTQAVDSKGGQGMVAMLLVVSEPEAICHPIRLGQTTVGRTADNDIRICADRVSRQHAQLRHDGHETYIEDLNSTNGVFVNGLRVTTSKLSHGDQIMLGPMEVRYETREA